MPHPNSKHPVQLSLLACREKWDIEIAQACRVHDQYLAEYGSFADALRAGADLAD